jgi:regulatory protein
VEGEREDAASAGPGPLAGRVTAIEPQARDPERVNLFLEGRFAFGLSAVVAADAGLRVGDVLTAGAVASLLRQESSEQALQQALLLLSYRARSEAEIRRSLEGKGHPPETVQAVIQRLQQNHFLDDEAFALTWVENRQRFRPRGARRLRAELRQKGVDAETTDRAIADAGGDERALALAVAEKRATGLDAADYAAFGRKVGGYLSRRGFAPEVVWDVVRQLWAARSGEPAPPDT